MNFAPTLVIYLLYIENQAIVGGIIIRIWDPPTQPSSEGWRVPSRFPQIRHFFYPIKLENYTRRIKSRFSEVLRTSPYPSQTIQLILTILTAVSLFPYLFWGMRNGSCRFSVYMLFLGIPWSYPDVSYIAGKTFLRGIQRSWNRGKRFSGDGVIRETSLTIMAYRGG